MRKAVDDILLDFAGEENPRRACSYGLTASGIKALGLTDGTHVLELVKCLPLFPDDKEGESVLASDYRQLPLWSSVPEAASATDACVDTLHLRYAVTGFVITPIA